MAHATSPGAVERLTQHLFDRDLADPLADEVTGWLAGSNRFRAFAQANRDKIRKKLRGAADAEARRDVRAELRVAHLLLADRRIELAFEAYGSTKRGPDFTVTFRGERSFNLEVTRPRRAQDAAGVAGPLLAKIRQLPPSVPNAVLLAVETGEAETLDVAAATRSLRDRADARDETYFTTRGFKGTREFYDRYLRLGGVLVWSEAAIGSARAANWDNRSARIALPERAVRASLLCLRAG